MRRGYACGAPVARSVAGCSLAVALGLGLAACGRASLTDATLPGANGPGTYWALAFRDRAINLSVVTPTDTVRLVATPLGTDGAPLRLDTALAAPTFSTPDTANLELSSAGLLRAKVPGTGLRVIASLQIGTVTHVDTAVVNVTDVAQLPSGFSIHPVPPDSARWSPTILAFKSLVPADAGGAPLTALAVEYASSDPHIATVDAYGALLAQLPGTVTLVARSYAYGVRLADSVHYTIGPATGAVVGVFVDTVGDVTVSKPAVQIAAGGTVVWIVRWNTLFNEHVVTLRFGDPTSALPSPEAYAVLAFFGLELTGGDIAARPQPDPVSGWVPPAYAARRFDRPGTYVYHDASGRVFSRVNVVASAP